MCLCIRFDEYVSSFLHIDEHHLLAASGEGTIQSFDLRHKKPDIQSEVYEGELNCMGTVRSGTKLAVGCGNGTIYLFRYNTSLYYVHSGISLSVFYQVGLVVCAISLTILSLEFA